MPIRAEFPLPGIGRSRRGRGEPVAIRLVTTDELARWWGEPTDAVDTWVARFPEGELVTVTERGDAAQRIVYGTHAVYGLSSALDEVLCAPIDETDPRWRRFLLDTVLWRISSDRGYFLLHAAALAGPSGLTAFASTTGGGKTTLALQLLRRGWRLVADDVLALERRDSSLYAHPAPGLMNAPAGETALEAIGQPLALLDGEVWLEVDGAASSAEPLRSLVLYERAPGHVPAMERVQATLTDVVPHLWDVRADLDRVRARFEFLADLLQTVAVYRLVAGPASPISGVAELVDRTLRRSVS